MKTIIGVLAILTLFLCGESAEAQIFIDPGYSIDSTTGFASCSGMTDTLGGNPTATGGVPPYTYSWSPGNTLNCTTCSNPLATPLVTTIYTVTVTDNAANTATASVYIRVVPPFTLTVTATHDTANYFRTDRLTAFVNSSQPAYYFWTIDGLYIGYGNTVTYNYPGTFECEAILNNQYECPDTVITSIQAGLTASVVSVTNNTCIYDSSGKINVAISGGTGNYTYEWSNGASTQNLSGLPVGIYTLTVHDDQGNVGFISQTVTAKSQFEAWSQAFYRQDFPDTLGVVFQALPGFIDSVSSVTWSNNVTSNIDVINSSGEYQCTVTDMYGCKMATNPVFVGILLQNDTFQVPENDSTIFLLQNVYYGGGYLDWEIQIEVLSGPFHGAATTNGDESVTYTPDNNFTGDDSFTYTACLGDSLDFDSLHMVFTGYCDTAVVYIKVIDSIVVNLQARSTTCINTCNGNIYAQVSGGMPPYTYRWNTGDTTPDLINLCPGANYTVTVTDANQALTIDSVYLTSSRGPLNLNVYSDTVTAWVGGLNDSIFWIYNWSTGVVDTPYDGYYESSIIVPQSGYYCVTVTNNWGSSCVLTACDTVGCIGCVWPGDANDDGIVDNNDLLPIGLAYGTIGSVRPNASLNWVGQVCPDWTDTLLTGTNYKFIDCNGDGTINADDTLAIHLNFGQIHLKSGEVRSWRSGDPALYANLSPDTLVNGETVTATFTLGSSTLPADNVYGIAFTYNYDPSVIDPAKTQISFGDSWFGASTDKISLAKDLSGIGQMECALTGIDHASRSGNGPIGFASFTISTDNIGNVAHYPFKTWISDLKVIDNKGNALNFNEGGDTATISNYPTDIGEINTGAAIKIFPNPAHEQLIIQSQNQLAMTEITLIDLLGEPVITQPVTQPYQTTIDVSSLSSGAYFVQVKTAGGTAMKRFVVEK